MLAETVQKLFTPEFSGDMWDTLEVSGLWPIEGIVNGGMEIGDRESVVCDQSEGMETGDDPVVNNGPSMEVSVEGDDQLVEDKDVDPDESLEEKYLDIEYDDSDDSDEELDIELLKNLCNFTLTLVRVKIILGGC